MEQAIRHPERFDPREGTGRLIDSEHRARYWWASRVVAGKDVLDAACGTGYGIEILASTGARAVTGVDLDTSAVKDAESRYGDYAEAILEGDLHDLPLEDASFDAVVCFEAIEHLENAGRALAELRRVLRPGGTLIVSSPNPDVYLGGNEHHVHEFRPPELTSAVGEHFAHVASYRQDAWLASMIESADDAPGQNDKAHESDEVLRTVGIEAGGQTYSLVVASNEALPAIPSIVALGDVFDVRWWSEQLANSKGETMQAVAREAGALERLHETSTALLDANQELAQIPLLHHRMATLEQQHAQLSARYHELLGSSTWRWTAPLRRLRTLGRS
jgi:ubiquinone/menaquinone biosynthesis C-methylase UbiE